ncbi:hypothetical protein ABZX65_26105 [Streptomyces sp. NPDC003300]|uniref:hypothetical protein n=1 Tax=unclassified Streptomyces TaxID=2593676 RepID=UPI0033BDC2FE
MKLVNITRYAPSRAVVDGLLADVLVPERPWYDAIRAAQGDELLDRWNRLVFQDLGSPTVSTDCWTWSASTATDGYGTFSIGGRTVRAHHVAWGFVYGNPAAYVHGLRGWERVDVSHDCHDSDASCAGGPTCQHRRCVNPEHLSLLRHSANVRAGRSGEHQRNKVACPSGHSYSEFGHLYTDPSGMTRRYCSACRSGGRAVEFIGVRKGALELAVAA